MATSPRVAFFAAATLALLLAASASSPPPPAVQRDVGDGMVRTTMVPSAGNGTEETLTQWAERQRFHVGDVLDFKSWNGTVLLLARRGDYRRCRATAASPAWRFAGGGGTEFVLDRPGTFYFASAVPGRCEAGRRMAVRVAVDAPFHFFAPTSGVDPGTTAPPPPPPTVVFKLTPSAWLWIATVGVSAALLICVICFCLNEQDKLERRLAQRATWEYYKGLSTELGRAGAASTSV